MTTTTPKGKVQVLIPPGIKTLMSGCRQISKNDKGEVTAWYTDGSIETIMWPEADMTGNADFFDMLGTIQAQRKEEI